MFDTVLIANRGEIAVRVIRTLRRLGVRSVAVYSEVDADALHVRVADEAVLLGPAPAAQSYLSIPKVIEAAAKTGAQTVHPGYGFLSENTEFAQACADAGLVFIGPPAAAIEAMGDKISAKQMVEKAGVPVVPGVHRAGMTDEELLADGPQVGFPLLVKATAGGGGKGMRIASAAADLPDAIASARREALGAFGDDDLLLERYVTTPRHIEIQVFADTHGTVVHLGERECSLQRRHQKVIEECPSPLLDESMRQRMGAAAVEAARSCGYVGAGTVEFIVSGERPDEFFFLEMNTRLQVEHPVTEQVYGVDLVEWQLRVAAGEPLPLRQEELQPRGWAVEARVYAEDPARGFLPTGGRVLKVAEVHDDHIRVDTGIQPGTVVGSNYDPMLAKVIATADDRRTALRRLHEALGSYSVLGITTNVSFLRSLVSYPAVVDGALDTGLIDRCLEDLVQRRVPDDAYVAAAMVELMALEPRGRVVDPFDVPDAWRVGDHAWAGWRFSHGGEDPVTVHVRGRAAGAEVRVGDGPMRFASARHEGDGPLTVTVDGQERTYGYAEDGDVLWLGRDGSAWPLREQDELAASRHDEDDGAGGPLVSPMPGTVTVVNVAVGDRVVAGQTLLVVEAMKMEHPITAAVDGVVQAIHVAAGQAVAMDEALAVVAAGEAS